MITVKKSISDETNIRLPCLAMRPREAAKALGISERLLWQHTHEGTIPHIRLGTAILYSTDALRAWLIQQSQLSVPDLEKKTSETEQNTS